MRQGWIPDVSELSRNIQALTGDVTRLRTEIERLRADLSSLAEQFLDEMNSNTGEQPGGREGRPQPGRSRAPHLWMNVH
jgi:uncharacterized coiled-coil protein SlyX